MLANKDTQSTTVAKSLRFPKSSPPQGLREFQLEFGNYLRSQLHEDGNNIPKRVGQLYQSLIFNNLKGFINQCFPVCQTLMTAEHWQELSLYFFQNTELESPYFTEINKYFVDFLYSLSSEQRNTLSVPDYLADLAHYEWVELLLDIYPNLETNFLLYDNHTLNSNLQNLHYQWPVHNISKKNIPEQIDTFLLVYRNPSHRIEFMEINALTHLLINFMSEHIQAQNHTFDNRRVLLTTFFESIEAEVQPQILDFGEDLLTQLEHQKIILTLD